MMDLSASKILLIIAIGIALTVHEYLGVKMRRGAALEAPAPEAAIKMMTYATWRSVSFAIMAVCLVGMVPTALGATFAIGLDILVFAMALSLSVVCGKQALDGSKVAFYGYWKVSIKSGFKRAFRVGIVTLPLAILPYLFGILARYEISTFQAY